MLKFICLGSLVCRSILCHVRHSVNCPQEYFHLNPTLSKICGCYVVPFLCSPTSTRLDLHNKTRIAVANLQ